MSSINWSANKVSASGVRGPVSSTETCSTGIQLLSNSGNVSPVWVGRSDVAVGPVGSGYPLLPGDSIFLPIRHPNECYVVTSGLVQTVNYLIF